VTDSGFPVDTETLIDLAAITAAFGHQLHAIGIPVTPERSARFAEAVLLAQPRDVSEIYWLGRVTLIGDHSHIRAYDAVFEQIFRGVVDIIDMRTPDDDQVDAHPTPTDTQQSAEQPQPERPHDQGSPITSTTPSSSPTEDDPSIDDASLLAAASTTERLGETDFAACTPEELALIRRLVEQLPLVPPMRRSRRTTRHRSGRELDIRATLRRAHRTGGDPVHRVHRRRMRRPRRVVLLADVSGSMESYARVYLHLLRGAVRALGAEAFVFATRLTRLTRPLSIGGPDRAYALAAAATPDYSGGTRIGPALTRFIDEHGRRGMARGAVIVIVSDGWEIGDTATLREAMTRLHRLAHRVIWVNPRKAAEGFAPLTGGMAAALPYVDTFVSGHSLRALEDVMDAISGAVERRAD
jgi:uncharacterized protein with von Willebrand factor type A (vWA) domain